jgi:hypothetical protein
MSDVVEKCDSQDCNVSQFDDEFPVDGLYISFHLFAFIDPYWYIMTFGYGTCQ